MTPNDEGGPPEKPDYKVYRSRRRPTLGMPSLGSLREKVSGGRGERPEPGERPARTPKPEREGGRSWLKWLGFALLGWLAISLISFAVSATIQKSKLADTGDALGGNPLLAAFPQNILVLGTDVRSDEFASAEQ